MMVVNISPTRIRDYLTCPYYFYQKHIEGKVPFQSNLHLSFGISVHRVLDELYTPDTEKVKFSRELLRRNWDESGYEDRKMSEHYFQEAFRVLELFLDEYECEFQDVLDTEIFLMNQVRFQQDLSLPLSCKIDLLHQNTKGELEVVDFKTNNSDSKLPTSYELGKDLATFIYYLMARINYLDFEKISVRFIYLVSLKETVVTYSNEQLETNKQALVQVLKDIVESRYPAKKNKFCYFCPVQSACPAFKGEVRLDSFFGLGAG